jgi:hypothetical protein
MARRPGERSLQANDPIGTKERACRCVGACQDGASIETSFGIRTGRPGVPKMRGAEERKTL